MKKLNFLLNVFVLGALTACSSGPKQGDATSTGSLDYTYHELALKELDPMAKLVEKKLAESRRSTSDKVSPLKQALRAVYSRPDDDGMIDKIVPNLRSALEDQDAWEKTVGELVDEAVENIRDANNDSAVTKVTYVILLQNTVAQLKPQAKKDGFERQTLERIRDARIELTKSMRDERKLRVMRETVSPSEMAAQFLDSGKKKKAKSGSEL